MRWPSRAVMSCDLVELGPAAREPDDVLRDIPERLVVRANQLSPAQLTYDARLEEKEVSH
jgi:hypothetical protein